MFTWPVPSMFRLPASGDVWQKVTNVTDWFSPKIEMNFAGDPRIEQEVTENVASYGKQLGVLMEAVVALGDPGDPKSAKMLAESIARLKGFQAEIEEIKKRRAPDLETVVMDAMGRLKSAKDPAPYRRVLERLAEQARSNP